MLIMCDGFTVSLGSGMQHIFRLMVRCLKSNRIQSLKVKKSKSKANIFFPVLLQFLQKYRVKSENFNRLFKDKIPLSMPLSQSRGNCIKHPSSLRWTVCFCYEGKMMESHQDMNANFVYEATHSRLLFISSLLWCILC